MAKTNVDSAERAQILLEAVEDRLAVDPVLIDLREKGILIADFFLICSCNSSPHLRAVWENVLEVVDEHRWAKPNQQGEASEEWRLLDFGDVVVHIMTQESRAYYRLEEFWTNPQPKGALPPTPNSIADDVDALDEDDEEAAFFEDADTEVEPIDEDDDL